VTTTTSASPQPRTWQVSTEARALMLKFPPRPVAESWPMTRQDRAAVEDRMATAPFRGDDSQSRCHRKASLLAVLDWLELSPGQSWQQRWNATGAGQDGSRDWRLQVSADLATAGLLGQHPGYVRKVLATGLIQLIGGDYLRPSLGWLLATKSPLRIANEMAKVRDPHGLADLRAARLVNTVGDATMIPAIEKIALIMAAKGGSVRDVTIGDCLEAMRVSREIFPEQTRASRHSPMFYQLLHSAGHLPADAPPTVRMFSPVFAGRVPVEQLVDRYQVACRLVRDVLVDYLRERQPAIDYGTLTSLATTLVLWFWKDLERHHPGIDSLRLSPETAAAWKQRIRTRTVRSRGADGEIIETTVERGTAADALTTVRSFIWISLNGRSTTRPAGDHGPFRVRSGPPISSTGR